MSTKIVVGVVSTGQHLIQLNDSGMRYTEASLEGETNISQWEQREGIQDRDNNMRKLQIYSRACNPNGIISSSLMYLSIMYTIIGTKAEERDKSMFLRALYVIIRSLTVGKALDWHAQAVFLEDHSCYNEEEGVRRGARKEVRRIINQGWDDKARWAHKTDMEI